MKKNSKITYRNRDYFENLEDEKFNPWRQSHNLVTIFNKLAISKIIHLASVTILPNSSITRLNKIYKEFICNHKRPKILSKIASLQCS